MLSCPMCRIIIFTGIAFQLSGISYVNNSVLNLTDIGEGDNALLCLTGNAQCCRASDSTNDVLPGEWYLPNGSLVPDGVDASRDIFRNRGPSVVRLNRRNNATSPTGVYRCEVPDASATNRSVFIGVNSNGNQGRYS